MWESPEREPVVDAREEDTTRGEVRAIDFGVGGSAAVEPAPTAKLRSEG